MESHKLGESHSSCTSSRALTSAILTDYARIGNAAAQEGGGGAV